MQDLISPYFSAMRLIMKYLFLYENNDIRDM